MLDASGSDAEDAASTITLGATAGASDAPRKGRPRAATPRELANVLEKLLGGATVLLAAWLEVEEAAMSPGEASAIAEPIARMLSRQKWAKAVTKRLVDGSDLLDLTIALGSYGLRVYPLVAAKLEMSRVAPRQAQPVWQAEQRPVQHAASNGASGEPYDLSNGVPFSGFAGFGLSAEN